MPSIGKLLLVCLALLAATGCAQNPVSGRQDFVMMSEAQEVSVGRRSDADIRKQYRVYEAPALQDYVDGVGQELARKSHRANLEYRFTVLDTPEVNAFALPGGYVYITRGILAYLNSEAELAAVLGHEIGHVTARHGVRQQSAAQVADIGLAVASIFVPQLNSGAGQDLANILGGALLSGYGREHELEADRLGAEYLARTEYDPQAMIRVVGALKNQESFDAEIAMQEGRQPRRYHGLFESHPDNDTRLQQVVGEAGHLAVANPKEGYGKFLQHIDGMTFSESADQGVVRDNKFMHDELGLALSFPDGWRVLNLPDKLVAVGPQSEAAMQLTSEGQPSVTPASFVRRLAGNSDSPIESLEIGGLPAAIATLPAAMVGVIYLDRKAYIIQGKAKSRAAFAANRNDMLEAIRSFHTLGAAERKLAKPLVIKLVTARPGDTYARLARHSPLGKSAEGYLRLINGGYPDGEPKPGQHVKIVE